MPLSKHSGLPESFSNRVHQAISDLQPGDCVTYGDIAAMAGSPGAARRVGQILADSEGLPWWRVVTAQGRLVPGKEAEHARLLKAEGVVIKRGRVVG